jgi:hypothetical protein
MTRSRLTKCVALSVLAATAAPAGAQATTAAKVHTSARLVDGSGQHVLRTGRLRVRVFAPRGTRLAVSALITRGSSSLSLAREKRVRVGRRRSALVSLKLVSSGRNSLRADVANCRRARVRVLLRTLARATRSVPSFTGRLSGGGGCRPTHGGGLFGVSGVHGPEAAFRVGAATVDFAPPARGALASDPSDCAPAAVFPGKRLFAFMEPYIDQKKSGHYDLGDPYVDCNGNGRWDGNYIGGGNGTPRYYTTVADAPGARAFVVSNGSKTIAVEVLDHEGAFNVYLKRIRDTVAAHGVHLDGIFISSTHDESAPDTLGLYGENDPTGTAPAASSVNNYWADFMVARSARAIEQAAGALRPAKIRYSEAIEPGNLGQCWSSYPFVDNQRMPVLQAFDSATGAPIVTLASVSQHTESLGFNDGTEQLNKEKLWLSADWPFFFRQALEQRYGGVAIEMAGSVGSVETPHVYPGAVSRTPQAFQNPGHPAGCRTLFNPAGTAVPLGYTQETQALGEQLAGAVQQALGNATVSRTGDIWGERRDVCIPITNTFFKLIGIPGIFASRPSYAGNCAVQGPLAPNGTTAGTEVQTQVAAFRIGDGEFISLPGEVFPFTYFRSFLGPDDMPFPQYGLPAWPLPHMHAPYRFFNGLAEDMIGYIFPKGNGIGVPGEDPTNPTGAGKDRFDCGHSDDSEAASSDAADLLGGPLVGILDAHGGAAEAVSTGRYVLPNGKLSRDPRGGPVLKCSGVGQTSYSPAGAAIAVSIPGVGIVRPAAWMSLSGLPQWHPDRDTRGWFSADGARHWLEVFPAVNAP